MAASGQKGVHGITHLTIAVLMDMETMGTHGGPTAPGRLVVRQAVHINKDPGTAGSLGKGHNTRNLRAKRSSPDPRPCPPHRATPTISAVNITATVHPLFHGKSGPNPAGLDLIHCFNPPFLYHTVPTDGQSSAHILCSLLHPGTPRLALKHRPPKGQQPLTPGTARSYASYRFTRPKRYRGPENRLIVG